MININKLKCLFNDLKKEKFISVDNMLLRDFTNNELNFLVKNGILEFDGAFYSQGSIKKLYEFGLKYLNNAKFKDAKDCFETCLLMDSNFSPAFFMLFLISLKNKSYKKIFHYYEGFYQDPDFMFQARMFIYLLGMLMDVPSKFETDLKMEDFNSMPSNEFKQFFCSLDCNNPFIAINMYIHSKDSLSFSDKVLSTLLQRVKNRRKRRKHHIINLLANGQYDELIIYLENQERLSKFQQYILKLVKIIVSKPGVYSSVDCTDVFEAIDMCNFKLAFDMVASRNENINLGEESDILFILLKKINQDLGFIDVKEIPQDSKITHDYSNFIDEVRANGLSLISNDDPLFSKVSEILECEPDVKVFYTDNYVVFKYSPVSFKSFDFKKCINDGEKTYQMNNLYSSLKCFRRLLESNLETPFLFARLGIIYLRLNKHDIASSYLRVATDLSYETQDNFDFTELLDIIDSSEVSSDDYKPFVSFSIKDFKNDIDIVSYDSRAAFCVREFLKGNSCDEIFNSLSDGEKQKVMLLLSREYYYLGDFDKGDKFLRMLEKSKNKSKEIIKLIEDTKVNKLFYKFRVR